MHAPAPTPPCILGLDALLLVPVKTLGARIKDPGASSRSAAAESLKRAEELPKRAALPVAGADSSNCSVTSDPVCNDALERCISLQQWLFWPPAVVCTQWLYVSCQLIVAPFGHGEIFRPYIRSNLRSFGIRPYYYYYYTLFLPRGKVRLQTSCSKGCQNPTPCRTRQIQARPNQPWARCSVFIPPPASRGQQTKTKRGLDIWL
jgi:hypothetical protein